MPQRKKKIFFFTLIFLLAGPFCVVNSFANDKKPSFDMKNFAKKVRAAALENLNSTQTEVYYTPMDFSKEKILRFFFDGRRLIRSKSFPANYKIKIFKYQNEEKKILKVLNRNLKSALNARKSLFITELDMVNTGDEVFIELYDTDDNLYGTYKLVANLEDATTTAIRDLENIDCDLNDPECLLKFIFENVNFSASYENRLVTEVTRNDSGSYSVLIPIKKGRKLTDRVRNFNFNSGSSSSKPGAKAQSLGGYYPYFDATDEEAVHSTWSLANSSASFSTNTIDDILQVFSSGQVGVRSNNKTGLLNIGASSEEAPSIVLDQGSLSTTPINGAIEYDGSNLYFTNHSGSRIALGSGGGGGTGPAGPAGPQGPAGPTGPMGPAGSLGINGASLNGALSFLNNGVLQDAVFNGDISIPTGANLGYVLTSSVNGLATWQPVSGINGSANYWNVDSNVVSNTGTSADVTADDFVFGSPSLDYDSDINHANRFFFDKSNGAFRAGRDRDGAWDSANLGDYSFAAGNGSIARGDNSFAFGSNVIANGDNSYIFANSAPGGYILAEGFSSRINATSIAADSEIVAFGDHSTVDGMVWGNGELIARQYLAKVDGWSIGSSIEANGILASAEGMISGSNNTITARGNYANSSGFSLSRVVADGQFATAVGASHNTGWTGGLSEITALGNGSFARGLVQRGPISAHGLRAHAIGDAVFANGDMAMVIGRGVDNGSGMLVSNQGNSLSLGFNSNLATLFVGPSSGVSTTGNVGIGTSNTAAKLDILGDIKITDGTEANGYVLTSDANGLASWMPAGGGEDNGNVFVVNANVISNNGSDADYQDDFVIGSPSLDDDTDAAHDSRMFFNKERFAFRAGRATANEWDDVNIGNGSAAFGVNSIARGTNSFAANISSANGVISFSTGTSLALDVGTVALGAAVANGQFSIAAGNSARALANNSVAIGRVVLSNGDHTYSFGRNISLSGNGSMAFGQYLTSDSSSPFAYIIGRGLTSVGDELSNNQGDSLVVGFNSNAATLFVGPSAGGSTTGNVGIATTTPAAKLDIIGDIKITDGTEANGYVLTSDVNGLATWQALPAATGVNGSDSYWNVDSNVVSNTGTSADEDADDFVFGSPSLDYDSNTAHAARMFFDKSSGAFRAGRSASTSWDSGNLGNYSVAFGNGTTASGARSMAIGYGTTASGDNSLAMGAVLDANSSIEASNVSAIAGGYAVSNGDIRATNLSIAHGFVITNGLILSSNTMSVAIGAAANNSSLEAIGGESLAFGYSNDNSLLRAAGIGSLVFANVDTNSTARTASQSAFVFGKADTNGNLIADGEGSLVVGYAQTYAMINTNGEGALASGYALRGNISSDGRASMAHGHVDGDNISAQGNGSYAFGLEELSAKGNSAFVHGANLTANGDYSFVLGHGNSNADVLTSNTANSLSIGFNSNAATFFVGPSAGGSTTGNVGIGTSSPARKLHISEAMRLEPQASPPGSPATGDLYVDSTGSQALCIYLNGAWVVAAGAGSCT